MSDSFRSAVFAKLNSDSTLTSLLATTSSIYHIRAPLDAAFPYIIIQKQAGAPVWSFAGPPMNNQLWMFKGVDRAASAGRAEDIAKRMDVVLTDAALTLTDGTLLYLRRETDIDYPEEGDPDFIVHNVGGSYRVVIDKA
jgi:Protein of unknown function (DUF3168)